MAGRDFGVAEDRAGASRADAWQRWPDRGHDKLAYHALGLRRAACEAARGAGSAPQPGFFPIYRG